MKKNYICFTWLFFIIWNNFSSEATNEMINEDEISAKSMSAEYKNLFSERESEENNIAVFSENDTLSFNSGSLRDYFIKVRSSNCSIVRSDRNLKKLIKTIDPYVT